jgi:site-specific DNA-methyltransferase (adenine-specific)
MRHHDIKLHPFMGSGTTAVSALKSDRQFVGYGTGQKYIKLAETRLSSYRSRIRFKS